MYPHIDRRSRAVAPRRSRVCCGVLPAGRQLGIFEGELIDENCNKSSNKFDVTSTLLKAHRSNRAAPVNRYIIWGRRRPDSRNRREEWIARWGVVSRGPQPDELCMLSYSYHTTRLRYLACHCGRRAYCVYILYTLRKTLRCLRTK